MKHETAQEVHEVQYFLKMFFFSFFEGSKYLLCKQNVVTYWMQEDLAILLGKNSKAGHLTIILDLFLYSWKQ